MCGETLNVMEGEQPGESGDPYCNGFYVLNLCFSFCMRGVFQSNERIQAVGMLYKLKKWKGCFYSFTLVTVLGQ